MNDDEKQRIISAAIQTNLLRVLASFARNTVLPGLANVGAREKLLLEVKSSTMGKADENQLLRELVCVIADLIEGKQTLPSVLESAGYVSGVEQSALERGVSIGDKITKRAQAKSGGHAKARRNKPVKEYAVRLANEGRYQSINDAAKEIAEPVLEFSKKNGAHLSEERIEKTIAEWLKHEGWKPFIKRNLAQ